MGPEEFQQDQLYFMARDELHQRALHGYGVVSGLGVSPRANPDTGNPEVLVAAGLAVNPRGESICVPRAQCGDLDSWLEAHRDDLLGSPPAALPGTATLYLVLCARDCETDAVPVLGDPCRTLEDATAASRIADDFELCLRLESPPQFEETAVRELGALLRAIEISDAGESLTPEQLADLVRELIPSGSPPEVGPIEPAAGSPPVPLRLHPDDAAEALAAAYRVWITEVRPALNPETGACEVPRDAGDGRCVLLACLEVPYAEGANGLVASGTVAIDTDCAPILVQTRVLQEMLLSAIGVGGMTPAPTSPATGVSPPSGLISHADLLDLDGDDHGQYLLVDPTTRALITDLAANGHLINGLGEPAGPSGDEAVRWDRAVKVDDAAFGDLDGTYPSPRVARLQGNPVAPGALGPADTGSLLSWDGSAWQPGRLPLEAGLTRIIALSWGHGESTLLRLEVPGEGGFTGFGLAIGFGIGPGEQAPVRAETLTNETLRVFLRDESTLDDVLPIYWIAELRPDAVLPVTAVISGERVIGVAPAESEELANGVLFQLDQGTRNTLLGQRRQLFIELVGEHVVGADGRAIDAEFPRAGLPSGDRSSSAALGLQGGRFESWVTARRPVDI
jgi:hypothetical protein